MANVNGVWDDFIQKFTTYSFKSIVESKANVNGVWDDNFIQKFTTYSFKSIVESKANVNVNGVGTWDDNSLFIQKWVRFGNSARSTIKKATTRAFTLVRKLNTVDDKKDRPIGSGNSCWSSSTTSQRSQADLVRKQQLLRDFEGDKITEIRLA